MNTLPALRSVARFSPARDLSEANQSAYAAPILQGFPHTHMPFSDAGIACPTSSRLAADPALSSIGGHPRAMASPAPQHSRKISALLGVAERGSTCERSPRLRRTVKIGALQLTHQVFARGVVVGLEKGKYAGENFSLPWAKVLAFSLDGVEVAFDSAGKVQFLNQHRVVAGRHASGHSTSRAAFASPESGTSAKCHQSMKAVREWPALIKLPTARGWVFA